MTDEEIACKLTDVLLDELGIKNMPTLEQAKRSVFIPLVLLIGVINAAEKINCVYVEEDFKKELVSIFQRLKKELENT